MQQHSSLFCKVLHLNSWKAFSLFCTVNANGSSNKEDVFQKHVITHANIIENKGCSDFSNIFILKGKQYISQKEKIVQLHVKCNFKNIDIKTLKKLLKTLKISP